MGLNNLLGCTGRTQRKEKSQERGGKKMKGLPRMWERTKQGRERDVLAADCFRTACLPHNKPGIRASMSDPQKKVHGGLCGQGCCFLYVWWWKVVRTQGDQTAGNAWALMSRCACEVPPCWELVGGGLYPQCTPELEPWKDGWIMRVSPLEWIAPLLASWLNTYVWGISFVMKFISPPSLPSLPLSPSFPIFPSVFPSWPASTLPCIVTQ